MGVGGDHLVPSMTAAPSAPDFQEFPGAEQILLNPECVVPGRGCPASGFHAGRRVFRVIHADIVGLGWLTR